MDAKERSFGLGGSSLVDDAPRPLAGSSPSDGPYLCNGLAAPPTPRDHHDGDYDGDDHEDQQEVREGDQVVIGEGADRVRLPLVINRRMAASTAMIPSALSDRRPPIGAGCYSKAYRRLRIHRRPPGRT
jgi:hypothetical protein